VTGAMVRCVIIKHWQNRANRVTQRCWTTASSRMKGRTRTTVKT